MRMNTILLAAGLGLGIAGAALATPITGGISIGGYADPVGSTNMGSATGLNFASGSSTTFSGSSGDLFSFGAGSGSFASLGTCASSTGSCGTIQDIANFASEPATANFLTFNTGGPTVTFDLASISSVSHDTSAGSVTISGAGTINFTGYDPTAGRFVLTAQGDNIVSFSASTLSAVPLPASAFLLIGAFAGLAALRRKKSPAQMPDIAA